MVQVGRLKHGPIAAAISLILAIGVSALWVPTIQHLVQPKFATPNQLALLQSLFLALGGALIGATAIVSSLVLFAMQVNIERMPHGLFRRLSADRRLLSAFAMTFILSVAIAALSIVQDSKHVGIAIFISFWMTAVILALFLYGYKRALALVNPVRQIRMVVRGTQRDLRAWERRAKRAAPLLTTDEDPRRQNSSLGGEHDLPRTIYFQVNPNWTDGARQGIRYAISLARRFAEQGDHEVSASAINAVIAINSAYVRSKGKRSTEAILLSKIHFLPTDSSMTLSSA